MHMEEKKKMTGAQDDIVRSSGTITRGCVSKEEDILCPSTPLHKQMSHLLIKERVLADELHSPRLRLLHSGGL